MTRSSCFLWLDGPATVIVAAPSLAAARSIVTDAARKKERGEDWARDIEKIVASPPELTIETRPTGWAGIVLEHYLMTKQGDAIRGGIYFINADPVKPRGNPNKIGGLWPPRKEPTQRRRAGRRQA